MKGISPRLIVIALLFVITVTYLSGCAGGTSSEGGNPDLVVQFRVANKPVAFHGFLQFYADGSNPNFFTPPPDDGSGPQVIIGDGQFTVAYVNGDSTRTFTHRDLALLINQHPSLSLEKPSARASSASIPTFNIVLSGSDSTVGWQGHIQTDSAGHFIINSVLDDTLVIELGHPLNYAGRIDTSMVVHPAVLFVPGTPYYSQVQGDSFHFEGIPQGTLPLRMVALDGIVYAMPDSLTSAALDSTTHIPFDTVLIPYDHALTSGTRVDSIALPPPVPTLAPPSANPPGQFAFTDSVQVALTDESGADIYYSLDGSTPNNWSRKYSGPLVLHASSTLKAVAYKKGYNRSPISVNNYELVPLPAIAAPVSQVFTDSLVVRLTTAAKGASIYYSLDGSEPGTGSTLYTAPIVLKATTTVKAITSVVGMGNSRVLEEKYVLLVDTTVTH